MSSPYYTKTDGNCKFHVNVGGRPGTANLDFGFKYSLFDGVTPFRTAEDEPDSEESPYVSDLEIGYDS